MFKSNSNDTSPQPHQRNERGGILVSTAVVAAAGLAVVAYFGIPALRQSREDVHPSTIPKDNRIYVEIGSKQTSPYDTARLLTSDSSDIKSLASQMGHEGQPFEPGATFFVDRRNVDLSRFPLAEAHSSAEITLHPEYTNPTDK